MVEQTDFTAALDEKDTALLRAELEITTLKEQLASLTEKALQALKTVQKNAHLAEEKQQLQVQVDALNAKLEQERKHHAEALLIAMKESERVQAQLAATPKPVKTSNNAPIGKAPGAAAAEDELADLKRKYNQLTDYDAHIRAKYRKDKEVWSAWGERFQIVQESLEKTKKKNVVLKQQLEALRSNAPPMSSADGTVSGNLHSDAATPQAKREFSPREPLVPLATNAVEGSQEVEQRKVPAATPVEAPQMAPTVARVTSGAHSIITDDETQDNGQPTPKNQDRIIRTPKKVKREPTESPIRCWTVSSHSTKQSSPPRSATGKRPSATVETGQASTVKRLCVEDDTTPRPRTHIVAGRRKSAHATGQRFDSSSPPCVEARRTQSSGSLNKMPAPAQQQTTEGERIPLWKTIAAKRSPLRLPQQPKNIGRYASAVAPAGQIDFSDFAVNPDLNDGVRHAFHEPVRGKDARSKVHAKDCACCTDYYKFAGPFPEQAGPRWRDKDPNEPAKPAMLEGERLKQVVSRHRERWHKSPTPELDWRPDFPTTQEVADDARRAAERREAKLQAMQEEALRGNGRIVFREEKRPPSSRKRSRRARD